MDITEKIKDGHELIERLNDIANMIRRYAEDHFPADSESALAVEEAGDYVEMQAEYIDINEFRP